MRQLRTFKFARAKFLYTLGITYYPRYSYLEEYHAARNNMWVERRIELCAIWVELQITWPAYVPVERHP